MQMETVGPHLISSKLDREPSVFDIAFISPLQKTSCLNSSGSLQL